MPAGYQKTATPWGRGFFLDGGKGYAFSTRSE